MLNYMGPNMGSAPVSAMLPPATPGTMPQGIPGVSPAPSPLPPMPPIHGAVPPPAAALAAILHQQGGPANVAPAPPPPPQYEAVTQFDGSILLHLKLPGGELGPVVKVLPPIKHPLNAHQPPNLQKA